MVQITKQTTELELKVGMHAYYEAPIHGSVGKNEKVEIDNEEVIIITKKKTTYANKDRELKPGADRATRTYTFEALSPGEAKITIQKVFRGRLENTYTIKCTVTE